MNVRLVGSLSVVGLLMGVASVTGLVRSGREGWFWMAIGLFCAISVARGTQVRRFAHGFLVGFLAGLLATSVQVLFFDTYLGHNPAAVESFRQLPAGWSPRVVVLALAPPLAILGGLVLGLFSWVAGTLVGSRPRARVPE